MTDLQIVTPTDAHDEVGLADWLEAGMVVSRRLHLPRAAIRKAIAEAFADDDDPDVTVDVALKEFRRRQRCCPGGYPFLEDNGGLRYQATRQAIPYLFMLVISTSRPYRLEHRQIDTDELFDELVVDALKRYVGGGHGLRFGSPASGGRPRNFKGAVAWLARLLNLPLGPGRARLTGGDRGLDVIAWKPFRDRRSGYLVLLAQCTVQLDWPKKARDLENDVWRGWIDFGKDPHLVLAVPFVVSLSYPKWDELRRRTHTILDRLRLCELVNDGEVTRARQMGRWTADEIRRLKI